MLTGAPACMSNKIHKGDRVVMVDEKPIDALGVGLTKLLTGCDIPGAASLICIHVLRYTGRYIHVCIPRYFKILNTYLYMRYACTYNQRRINCVIEGATRRKQYRSAAQARLYHRSCRQEVLPFQLAPSPTHFPKIHIYMYELTPLGKERETRERALQSLTLSCSDQNVL